MRIRLPGIFALLFAVIVTQSWVIRERGQSNQQPVPNSHNDTTILELLNKQAWELRNFNPQKAILLIDSAIRFAKDKKLDKSLIIAYNNLGIIFSYYGDYNKANDWIVKGFNIASEKNDLPGIVGSLNNLAMVYRKQGHFDKSIENINLAFDIEKNNQQPELVGNMYINMAQTYKEMGEFAKALDFYNQALKSLVDSKDKDMEISARLYIAEIYLISGNSEKAHQELKELWPASAQQLGKPIHLLYHQLLGDYYFAVNNIFEAEIEYSRTYQIAKEMKDIQLSIAALDKLVNLYAKSGNFRNAYFYQAERQELKDSLNNSQNYKLLSRIDLQEEFAEKNDYQIRQNNIRQRIQELEISHHKKISGYLLLILIFILVFGAYVYFIYRQKLKDARLLTSQREEILVRNEALRQQMIEDQEKNELIEFINHENEILSLVAKETTNTVFIINPDGTIEWVNEAFKRLSGYSLNEFKRFRGSKIQDASYSDSIVKDFNKCLKSKKPVSYISKSYTKDNKLVWIHTTLTPVLNNESEVERLIAIDSDITNFKEAQEEIDYKNQEITSSLEYASRIQNSIMPLKSEMDEIFSDYFIINLPQSIVSGDFYWAFKKNDQTLVVVGDSTGHGVPGAFMSLLGISSLQEIVYNLEHLEPTAILEQLRERIIYMLHYGNNELSSLESWDIAVCVIDENRLIKFAGSNNSVLILRDDVVIELKPDKFFIWDEVVNQKAFTLQTMQLHENDKIYLFTDGFSDQFGGHEDKKFSRRRLKKLLLDIYSLPMESQKDIMNMTLKSWKGQNEQVDDIMVLGFRV